MMFQLHTKGWQFVILIVIISIVPYYFILSEHDSDSPYTLLLMWVPAIAAIIMRLYYKEGLFKGNHWNPIKDWKWIFVAAFIPFFVEISSLLLTLLMNGATVNPNFISSENGLISVKGVAMIFGAAPQPWYYLIPNYLLSYFVGALFYSLIFAFGEEYGWRGYLQNTWAKNNELKGFVFIGILWGLWHLPAILRGQNYPDYPILGGFVLMPLLCIIFSVVFGISKNRKNMIWIAAIFHGSLNISADVSNSVFQKESLVRPVNDTIWTLLWLLVAITFWYYIKPKKIK